MNFLKLLKQPAPVSYDKIKIIPAILIATFITLFLFIFQPFGFNGLGKAFLHSLGYGLITFFTYLIYQIICFGFYKIKMIKNKNVTVLSNILNIIILVTFIACMNFFYSAILFDNFSFELYSFLFFLMVTFSIAIFPSAFFVYLSYVRELKKNETALSQIQQNNIAGNTSEIIVFSSKLGKDEISLDSSKIICFQSQGNYIEINYFEENKTLKRLIRSTLKEIEELLLKHKSFIKVHRSFIVNSILIEKSTGNSQGIQLFLRNTDIVVPVSRNYVSNFK